MNTISVNKWKIPGMVYIAIALSGKAGIKVYREQLIVLYPLADRHVIETGLMG